MTTDGSSNSLTPGAPVDPELTDLPQPETPEGPPPAAKADAPPSEPEDVGHKGWVPFYRAFQDEWWWTETRDRPWSYGQMFVDLYARANLKPRTAQFNGHIVMIGRGQLATSITALATRAGVDRKTIRKFLQYMIESGELAVPKRGADGIIVTICKYDIYALTKTRAGQ